MNYRSVIRRDFKPASLPRSKGAALFHSDRGSRSRQLAVWLAALAGVGAIVLGLLPGHDAGATRTAPDPLIERVRLELPLPPPPDRAESSQPAAAQLVERVRLELPLPPPPDPAESSQPTAAPTGLPFETAKMDPASTEDPPRLPEPTVESVLAPPKALEGTWHAVQIGRGDTLAKVFSSLGLSARTLHRLVNATPEAKQLTRLFPGETVRLRIGDDGRLLELIHEQDVNISVRARRTDNGFQIETIEREFEVRPRFVSGEITDSLYQAAHAAGMPEALIMELAGIFGWDVDFALDIRRGDRFAVLYEEKFLDGAKVKNGTIIAAEFVNQGKEFRAVRYQDAEGHTDYYTPDGHSMRKAFLRAPVDFRRISSRFQKERYHPVLGKRRPHRGVDYAAATGTPIKAAGDGKVIFAGRKGGYGKTVIVKHGEKYTTLYAHMSRIRPGMRNGKRVAQGQVIGYVGKTGLATGPHLHYEFRVNGAHHNPLTVKLPKAAPIDQRFRADYLAHAERMISQLETFRTTRLASNTH